MKRQALVTGGAGFIGSHLCELLVHHDWNVRVLDDFSTGLAENVCAEAQTIRGCVCDPEVCARACAGVDTVFHLAARVSVRQSVEEFYEDAETNLMGTLCVFRAAAVEGVRRLAFASSMAVYADSPPGSPVTEGHAVEPKSPYGLGKLAAERYVQMMAPEVGLEPVILRLFNTYGTRQTCTPYVGVVTIFVNRILAGEPAVIFGDGEQRRDFVHVSDVARGFLKAAESPNAPGEVFNLGSGTGTTVNELAQILQGLLGPGAFVNESQPAAELRDSVADISKARELLGYEPQGVLADCLPEVVEHIRNRVT